jgi:repressor LexA
MTDLHRAFSADSIYSPTFRLTFALFSCIIVPEIPLRNGFTRVFKMQPLTKRQKEILDFIARFTEEHGYAPSLDEIASHFRLSSASTVHQHLLNLEEKGFISRQPGRSRAVIVTAPQSPSPESTLALPLLGRIAAGQPIEAILDHETLTVPSQMVRGRRTFALQVKGTSMIEENVQDGDYIVVEQADTANQGDMVVALIDNDRATLKRFYRERDHIRLQPANPEIEPIIVTDQAFKIQGIVIGLLRKYT